MVSWIKNYVLELIDRANPLRHESADTARVGRVIVFFMAIGTMVGATYAIIYSLLGMYIVAGGMLFTFFGAPTCYLILRVTKSPTLASHIATFISIVAPTFGILGTGWTKSSVLGWYIVPPFLATLTLGRKRAIPWMFTILMLYVFIYLTRDADWIPESALPLDYQPLFNIVVPGSLALCAFLLAWTFALAQETALKQINSTKEAVERAHASARVVLDNVNQGLAGIRVDGRMSLESSLALEQWFGAPKPDEYIWDYISEIDNSFATMLQLEWEVMLEGFLPREVSIMNFPSKLIKDHHTFHFEYQPLNKYKTSTILLVVTDITQELAAAEVKKLKQELVELFVRFINDQHAVIEYVEETRALVRILGQTNIPKSVETQILHTIKGSASLMGLQSFTHRVHLLEDLLAERSEGLHKDEKMNIEEAWHEIEEGLHPILRAREQNRITISLTTFEHVLQQAKSGTSSECLAEALQLLTWDKVEDRLSHLAEQAKTLAQLVDKANTKIVVISDAIAVEPSSTWRSFWIASIHAIRNALDHGIEPHSERTASGKEKEGTLQLIATSSCEGMKVIYQDDGRGVDWEFIRRKAESIGLRANTQGDLIKALFTDGLSTRENISELSGRGVGTSALKAACEELGGSIDVISKPGYGAQFIFKFPPSSYATHDLLR